jgi:hypothetical protein
MFDLYRQLLKYGIDKPENVHRRIKKLSDHRLSTFLQEYEEIAKSHPLVMPGQLGATSIFPDSRADPLPQNVIRQLAIYARRIYIHDPILTMVQKWQYLDSTVPLIIQSPDRKDRTAQFRDELADEIAKLMSLRPLVDAGIVHITPSELIQFTKAPNALYTNDFYGIDKASNDALGGHGTIQDFSPEIEKYCLENLQIMPAKYVDNEPRILFDKQLSPCNMIAIVFPKDIVKFYHLFNVYPDPDGDDDHPTIHMHFDTSGIQPVNPEMFKNWVSGSKYEFLNDILSRLENDLILAAMAQAKFTTNLKTSRALASLSLSHDPITSSEKVMSALLQFELPFFERADFRSIAKARQNEAAFADFTVALDKAFDEIEALPRTADFQVRVEEIYRDLLLSPLANISRQMKILKRNLFLDAMILVGSLSATFITQGNNLVTAAAILAAAKVAEMYKLDKAQEDEIKQLPSFFYWDATQ